MGNTREISRVLLVDDQLDVAQTLGGLLVAAGMSVSISSDGENALARLQLETFDLLVVDMKMPPGEWGGVWLLQQLQTRFPRLASIVLTGEGSQEQTVEALRAGALDWLRKDQALETFVPAVKAALEKARGRAALAAGSGPSSPRIDRLPIEELVKVEEGPELERKASVRMTVPEGIRERALEKAVFKTVAGFLNSVPGGVLLIGVQDDGSVYGIEKDFAAVRPANRDAYERWLIESLAQVLGGAAVNLHVRAVWEEIEHHVIGRIVCSPSDEPVFLSGREFYVRQGNATSRLEGRDMMDYLARRWRHSRD